jgi:hypothetical protein
MGMFPERNLIKCSLRMEKGFKNITCALKQLLKRTQKYFIQHSQRPSKLHCGVKIN